jgi:NAD(P)-dependent dehydrogenase (short-subunit alcohol dehydrogenase family)
MDNGKNLFVVTGADSGIGKSLVEVLLGKGFAVAATYLKSPGSKGAVNIPLDLRREEDIRAAASRIGELVSQGFILRCLIDNAGVAMGGPIENLPMALFRETFEVNFFGLISFTQKMIPHLVKSRGRIVIVGSAAGRTAAPFLSPYVSTKFALEGFSDCLRREMLPYGIRTILLEPGGIATPIWNNAKGQDISFVDEKYGKSMDLFRNNFIESGNRGMKPDDAAVMILKKILKKNPAARYVISSHPLRDKIIRMIPGRILDSVFLKMFGMDYGKDA